MMVRSNWRVTFDHGGTYAMVLLDHGDDMDEELAFPWAQRVDTATPMRAAAALQYARNAVETTLQLAVYRTHASHAAARNYLLAHAASLPLGVTRAVRFDVLGGAAYSLSSAAIASGDGRMVVNTGAVRTLTKYTINGGKITAL